MAVSKVYTALAGDTITADRWNAEFDNIIDNGTDVAFPLTKAVSFAGFTITWDASGNTTMVSSGSAGLAFAPGNKTGTPSTTGGVFNSAASTFTDSATAGSGTATVWAAWAIQRPTLAATNTSVATTDAATLYIANSPANGTNETITNPWALWVDAGNARFDGTVVLSQNPATALQAVPLRNINKHIFGLTYSNGTDATNDIDFAAGGCVDSTGVIFITCAAMAGKQLDVDWAPGAAAGMRNSGVAIDNVGYYLYAVAKADGTQDYYANTSTNVATVITALQAETGGADYLYARLIGWIKRVAGTIVAFDTYETEGGGLELVWDVPTLDVNLANTLTTTRRTDAVKVPLNFSTIAHLNVILDDAAAQTLAWICCPDVTDAAPSGTAAPLANLHLLTATVRLTSQLFIRTSATGTIAARSTTATTDLYAVSTQGFMWARRN